MLNHLRLEVAYKSFDDEDFIALESALVILTDWYDTGSRRGDNDLVRYLAVLVKYFPYTPYRGPLFRAFPLPEKSTFQEGQTLKLRVSKKKYQSWTTSKKLADEFGKWIYLTSFVTVQLKDIAHQLVNYDWVLNVVRTISKLPDTNKWRRLKYKASVLEGSLLRVGSKEDEVILLAKPIMNVKVVTIKSISRPKGRL